MQSVNGGRSGGGSDGDNRSYGGGGGGGAETGVYAGAIRENSNSNWKKMGLENLRRQVREGGSKIMMKAIQILSFLWGKLRRTLFYVLDRLFPPYLILEEITAAATAAGGDGDGHHEHGHGHGDGDGEHSHHDRTSSSSSSSASPSPSPSPSAPSSINNNEAWRRWFYHLIVHFFYPYIIRFADTLLARFKSLDRDP